ncbi:hypothetical protein DL796_11140 [Kangiella spongicola]|uniref:Uncharacterized protein n=1 Tax=Kangiella spongicola TaxID=796379 RepID=A0A318D0X5_9GAMM|nr:hypothetical protein DL796_11140 [Kangiella spongicola]
MAISFFNKPPQSITQWLTPPTSSQNNSVVKANSYVTQEIATATSWPRNDEVITNPRLCEGAIATAAISLFNKPPQSITQWLTPPTSSQNNSVVKANSYVTQVIATATSWPRNDEVIIPLVFAKEQ